MPPITPATLTPAPALALSAFEAMAISMHTNGDSDQAICEATEPRPPTPTRTSRPVALRHHSDPRQSRVFPIGDRFRVR